MTNKIHQIHDKYFRKTLSYNEVAKDFLDNYLPRDVLNYLDLSTLAIRKDSFVGSSQAGHYSDLLYEVQTTVGQAFVYLLFEHKSTPDRFIALQMLRYMLEIWELFRKQSPEIKTLPLIIPIVFYHGKPAQSALTLGDLVELSDTKLKGYIPDFALAFLDFSPEADITIKGKVITQLILQCLRAKNEPQAVEHLRRILRLISELDESDSSIEWIRTIFLWVMTRTEGFLCTFLRLFYTNLHAYD